MSAGRHAPTVVVLHGVKNNRTDVIRPATVLRRAGFNVLFFDGRAHEGHFVTYGFYERRDVESAIEWLVEKKKIDRNQVGLAGESMGAAIALQVAAHNRRIRAVWADSPFASLPRVTEEFVRRITRWPDAVLNPVLWTVFQIASYRVGFDMTTVAPLELAPLIECPVFLIHGTDDQFIGTAHSEDIYDALSGQKEIWLIEGVPHACGSRRAKAEYSKRMVHFFDQNLRQSVMALDERIPRNNYVNCESSWLPRQ
jgi:uncharacterized protein